MMQRRKDRTVRGEPRSQGRMNLRRMGWPVGPEGAESSWKMRICMNILVTLKTTGKLKMMYLAPLIIKAWLAVCETQMAKS